MKNITKIISIGILTLFLFTTVIPVFSLNQSITVDKIFLNYSFSDPEFEKITIGDKIYDRITINSTSNSGDINKPCLPIKSAKILIPYGEAFKSLELETSNRINLGKNYKIELGQQLFPIDSSQVISKNNYEKEIQGIYPEQKYTIIGPYNFRGYSILYINLHPIQYDSETGEIYYYKNMKINIKTEKSTIPKTLRNLQKDCEIVTKMVENPSIIDTYPEISGSSTSLYEYIIITSDDLSSSTNRNYNFEDLVQSKIIKGVTARIFTVEDILDNPDYGVNGPWGDNNDSNPFYFYPIVGDIEQFDDDQARIRNFLRYAYTELGTSFVLFGGDADFEDTTQNIVPVRCIYANETGLPLSEEWFEEDDIPSDVYYAGLHGNFNYDGDDRWGEDWIGNNLSDEIDEADLLAELWVGRACIDSESEVSNFTQKTITYETTNDLYLNDILFVGEHLGFPGVSEWGGNYKDVMIPIIPEDYNLEFLYDRDLSEFWTKYDMMDILNDDTPHIINHDGHSYYGYNMRMGNYDVDSLTNEKYFFVYSHGCMAGGFDNPDGYDCIAEHYTVKTTNAAIGGVWNARYGLGSNNTLDSPSGAYDISFFKAIFEENITQFGRANDFSKIDNIFRIMENGMRWCFYETNLFGDPEISFFDHINRTPPGKPCEPAGPYSGKPGIEYEFCSFAFDSEGSELYYWFDWGDQTNSGWIGPYPSGELACANHSWYKKGKYEIRVKAKNLYGLQSEWSDPIIINMPRSKKLVINFLEKFPVLYLLFQHLFCV